MTMLIFEPLPTRDGKRVKSLGGVELKTGLYRIYWHSGGSSLAAIGLTHNGSWWIAPTNWIVPAVPLRLRDYEGRTSWEDIEKIELIER